MKPLLTVDNSTLVGTFQSPIQNDAVNTFNLKLMNMFNLKLSFDGVNDLVAKGVYNNMQISLSSPSVKTSLTNFGITVFNGMALS